MKEAIVDFHVHIYPEFELAAFLSSFLSNTAKEARHHGDAIRVMCLVERHQQTVFKDLCSGAISLPSEWTMTLLEPTLSLRLSSPAAEILVVAGRQIVAQERIEILSIGADVTPPDGHHPADTIIQSILVQRGIPVIAWAPGKWLFSRSKVVRTLLKKWSPGQVAIGDTSLRPRCYSGGSVFREADPAGYAILPGSDPLPVRNEGKRVGSYIGITSIDPETPVQSLLAQFKAGSLIVRRGKRPHIAAGVLRRMIAHSFAKRRSR